MNEIALDARLRLERDAPAARLVLDRPEKRNAVTEAMWRALPARLEEARRIDGLRLLLVEGAGDHFAAGADIEEMAALADDKEAADAYARAVTDATDALAAFPLPTIALIRGACIGGGCGLALACDLRIADATARLGVTAAKLGLLYSVGDTRRLIEAVGASRAREMLFTASVLEAREALRAGLVDRVTDPGDLDTVAANYAREISGMSPASVRMLKQFVAQALDAGESAQSRQAFADAFRGPDFAEGRRAFAERRPPRFPEA